MIHGKGDGVEKMPAYFLSSLWRALMPLLNTLYLIEGLHIFVCLRHTLATPKLLLDLWLRALWRI